MARITHYAAVILLVLGTFVSCQNSEGPAVTTDQPPKTPAPPQPAPKTPAPPQPAPPKPDPKTTAAPAPTAAPTEAPTAAPTDPPTEAPTEAPTTTAAPAPAPTPADSSFYNVTENNVTCIMIDGDFSFSLSLDNVTGSVSIPKHGAEVSGKCNDTDGSQSITVKWGKNSARMEFLMAKNMWNISSYTADLVLDGGDFNNTSLDGKKVSVTVDLVMSPVSVSVNHSYSCISEMHSGAEATLDGAQSNVTVTADMDGMHIQAFNMIANEPDFVDATHCTADETSDIVPIAVGCALAGLVVIVLIAYLVGRRRRSAAYQSV